MTKKGFLILALLFSLSAAAVADETDFTSTDGTFAGDSHGYILTGAPLTSISTPGGSAFAGSDLGTLSFTTNFLGPISSVVFGGPIIPGGTLAITGNGTDGAPAGVLFSGTFPDGGTWTPTTQPDGTTLYTLTADVSGQDANGVDSSGVLTFTINQGFNIFPGTTSAIGTTTLSISPTPVSVPEPGQMALLGGGLLGIMGAVWRKRPSVPAAAPPIE